MEFLSPMSLKVKTHQELTLYALNEARGNDKMNIKIAWQLLKKHKKLIKMQFTICDVKLYHACVSFITTRFIIPKKVITGCISEWRRIYCKLSPRNADMNSHKGCTLRN
jgi:hypothetical protein